MVAVVAIPSVRPRCFEEVLAEKNIMRTTTTSVKRSVKIAHTPVLTESGGSTCLSESELLLRGLATTETDIRAHSGGWRSARALGRDIGCGELGGRPGEANRSPRLLGERAGTGRTRA